MNLRTVLHVDIKFNCTGCGTHIVIDEAGAGLSVQCPRCGQALTVPPARADVVIDASSAIQQAVAEIESGLFDDDKKLDEYFRKQSPAVLAASFGKKHAKAFLDGKINGKELLDSGFKLSPKDFSDLSDKFKSLGITK